MARDFTDILNAVWAANALTTIPNPPIPGQAYRNTEIDDSNLKNGQQYSEVYDSARYNQLLYLLSGCLKMLMETGLPEWSAEQNYQKGAYTVGSDGEIYGPAKEASGPDNGGAVDPVTDAAGDRTTWQRSLPKFAPQFGAYSKVVDGYVASAAVIDDTTSINNITTPGRYIIGTSVANTPVSLSAPSMLVVFGVTTNDGASFAASTLQILYAENPNGSTEVWTRAASAANTWGTWKRQDAGSLQPFVAPTASSSGKQGLVPAPQAVDPSQQAMRPLCANGQFNTLTAGSFDVSWERADSTNIVLGAEIMADNQDINDVLYAGDYYANAWVNAPVSGSGVYSLREMRQHGDATDSTRIQYAFFYAIAAKKIFWRGGSSKRAAGQPMTWATDWQEILGGGGTDKAPMPHAPDGMVGSWQLVIARSTDPYLRIPAGGSWAVYSGAMWVDGVTGTDGYASIYAGGTAIGPVVLYTEGRQSALCYKIQNSSHVSTVRDDKDWQSHDVLTRKDGSYVITVNGLPYHVLNEGYYAELWTRVDAFAKANSSQVKEDTSSAPEPSEEQRLELYKNNKLQAFKKAMNDIDIALVRPMSQLILGTNAAATMAEDNAVSDMTIFTTLREAQERNRMLREQVLAAQTVEAVQAIEPVTADGVAL